MKFSFSTVFDNTNKPKKLNLGAKLFVPKSGSRCHCGGGRGGEHRTSDVKTATSDVKSSYV